MRSIFLQGLLLNYNKHSRYFSKWKKLFYKYEKYVSKKKISKLEFLIEYVFSFDIFNKIVIGVDNLNQLQEIISVLKYRRKKIIKKFISKDKKLIYPYHWNKK